MTLESICPLPAVSKYTVDPKVESSHPDYVEKVWNTYPPTVCLLSGHPSKSQSFIPCFSLCPVSLDYGTRCSFPPYP